jgi:hypothetical protein
MGKCSWDEVEVDSSNATTVMGRGKTTITETIVQGNNKTSDSETSDSDTARASIQDSDLEESLDGQLNTIDDDEDNYDMTSKSADTAIWVVLFNRKKDEFDPWYKKQLARAKVKGFKGYMLNQEGDIPESDYDIDGDTNLSDDEKKELKRRKECNENAFRDLMMSIDASTPEGRVLFNLVKGCKT